MDETDFAVLVRESLVKALELDAGTAGPDAATPLLDIPNMTSLGMMRTLALIEMRLDIELDDDELVTVRTVGELTEAVRARHAGEWSS